MGRRNSWISSISSKLSSGSTPPSPSNARASPSSPKSVAPASKADMHNPFGAAYSPKDKEEERKDNPLPPVSTSPRGTSFLSSALRRLSSGSGGMGKAAPNGAICERRVMNIDQNRDRCKVPELDQGKLRRVAFCVDVEIAGVSRRESEDDVPPNSTANSTRRAVFEPNSQKAKKPSPKTKEREEGSALKNPQAVAADKEKQANVNGKGDGSSVRPSAEAKANGEDKEPSRKHEKKKRSEEERRDRKERKRRHAEASGSVPMQLKDDAEEGDSRAATPGTPRSKAQNHPTTDPVRIYRRCCQLRETPVLKRVVDEISKPTSTLAESPGTVAALDLSNFPMTAEDVATFSDWLAVVPVRKLLLENCALTDESVREILAALLSAKTVEQMKQRRKRAGKCNLNTFAREERLDVVEKLSLKNNSKIGPEGWRHICLFIHLSKSLKAVDLSGIQFPKTAAEANGPGAPVKPQNSAPDVATVFATSLAERLGGAHLEELLLTECNPTTEAVGKICDAVIAVGMRRFGFANNGLTREGFEHIIRYLKAGKCEGLDLGGNDIHEHLDLLVSAIERDHPLYALSLADCSLTPPAVCPLLQGLTRLPHLRFVDFSHNRELFSTEPDSLAMFRRFLPKMAELKRIHLADVDLSADHTIALAEVLPDCPSLCHLNILENSAISRLASATDPGSQEEACAVYASLMAAVRVSRSIIAVDIEVPSGDNNEIVKALASQIVAYCLGNLERGAIEEELSGPEDPSATREQVPVPEILQHIVGNAPGDEPCEEEDEISPDVDYVIGGTGVVKALGVCLGTLDHHGSDLPGDSGPPSGATTPKHRKSRSLVPKRPRDMSRNLLESARNIRTRIQSALVREDRAGNDTNYSTFLNPSPMFDMHLLICSAGRLQFLDMTLHRMIQRFEEQYPETRVVSQAAPSTTQESSSQHSGDDGTGSASAIGQPIVTNVDGDTAIDDEDTDQYAVRLSRSSSVTSLHSRAMTSEEGHVHRLGQNLRRDFLNPSLDQTDDGPTPDDSHIAALREKLDRLHDEQARSEFESVDPDKTFEELGSTVDDLWTTQRQDTEAFERFKLSQIAAQINSGKRTASSGGEGPDEKSETEAKSP